MKDLNFKSYHYSSHHHPYHPYHQMAPRNSTAQPSNHQTSSFPYPSSRNLITNFNHDIQMNSRDQFNFSQETLQNFQTFLHNNNVNYINSNSNNNNNNNNNFGHATSNCNGNINQRSEQQRLVDHIPTTHLPVQSCYPERQDQHIQANQPNQSNQSNQLHRHNEQLTLNAPAANVLNSYANNLISNSIAANSSSSTASAIAIASSSSASNPTTRPSSTLSNLHQRTTAPPPPPPAPAPQASMPFDFFSQEIPNNNPNSLSYNETNENHDINILNQIICPNNKIANAILNNNNSNNNIINNSYFDLPFNKPNPLNEPQELNLNNLSHNISSNNNNCLSNNIDRKNINNNEKFCMDANEIANFLAKELFAEQLITVEGIPSVSTNTTPTITPSQMHINDESNFETSMTNPPYQAGFKPPPINTQCFYNMPNEDVTDEESDGSYPNFHHDESSQATTDNSSAATDTTSFQNGLNGLGNNSLTTSSSTNDFANINFGVSPAVVSSFGLEPTTRSSSTSTSSNRRSGGRRPAVQTNLSAEEEEKRKQRRERNKLAAARCRKRRVDQTNDLQAEVEDWEQRNEKLRAEVAKYTLLQNQLQKEFQAHKPICKKIQNDILTVNTLNGIISSPLTTNNTGLQTTLASIANRSASPLNMKTSDILLQHIKNEPEELHFDNSSLDEALDGPPSKRPLPNVASLQLSLQANANLNVNSLLNTPILQTPPNSFKSRPDSLSLTPRNQLTHKQPTEIHGVPIQTPSTGTFNFDSLMDGGTGLTPVAGPLIPNCSTQNKMPIELTTPTSEPSKLVSL